MDVKGVDVGRRSLLLPLDTERTGCDSHLFPPGVCPCGWRECPSGQRYGLDSPGVAMETGSDNNTASFGGHTHVFNRVASLPNPLLEAFVAHVTAVLGDDAAHCNPVRVEDLQVVRCPRPPVLLNALDLGADFDVEIAHRTSYAFQARGHVKNSVVVFTSVGPLSGQGVCRSGLNEPSSSRRHWAFGCFCHGTSV